MQLEEDKKIQMAQILQKEDISNFKKKYRRGNIYCLDFVSRKVKVKVAQSCLTLGTTWTIQSMDFFFPFIFISWRLIILQYCSGFCHTLT